MRRAALFFLVLAPVTFVQTRSGAQEADPAVTVIKVDGSIDRTVDGYLRDAIAAAEADGATLILQLDSAGTLDVDPVALAERIHETSVPVVAWVGPAPAKAQGAALLMLYAASVGAIAPGAGVGPLAPLDLASTDRRAEGVEGLARRWASERERDEPQLFPAQPVPARAALDGRVVDVVATSVPDLLEQLDGRTVGTREGAVVLRTKIATTQGETPVRVRFVDLGPIDRVLHAAASPTWIYVLLLLGAAALAFELTQPGFGFAGFSGVGMVALGVYGLTVVPFSWVGLGLLLLGLGALTLDVRLRRLGALTALGLGALGGGSLLVFSGVADQIDVSPWLIGSFLLAALLFWGFGLTVAVQSRERITQTQRGLVGLVGETRGELKPDGPVYVKGAMWRGRTVNGPIPPGTRVRVRAVDGLILRVQPEAEPPAAPSPGEA